MRHINISLKTMRWVIFSIISCGFACTKNSPTILTDAPTVDESPTKDEDVVALPPVPVSGVYLTMGYDDGRIRCDYQDPADGQATYQVDCQVVVLGHDGSEMRASNVAKEVQIAWLEPKITAGTADTIACDVTNNQLGFTCQIAITQRREAVKATFTMSLEETTTGQKRNETNSVVLPFSVGIAAGLVPSLPIIYQGDVLTPENDVSSNRRGFQPQVFDLRKTKPFSVANSFPLDSVCTDNSQTYISVFTSIFVIEENQLQIFAGTGSSALDDLSHRHRVRLGMENILACSPGALFVADRHNARILRINKLGQVVHVAGSGQIGDTPDGASAKTAALNDVVAMTIDTAGLLVFAENGSRKIRRINADGRLTTLATVDAVKGSDPEQSWFSDAEKLNRIKYHSAVPALTTGKDGSLLFANNAQIKRLLPDGTVSVVVGSGAFGTATAGINALNSPFMRIRGLSEDDAGNLFFADAVGLYQVDGNGVLHNLTQSVKVSAEDGSTQVTTAARKMNVPLSSARDVSLLAVQNMSFDKSSREIIFIEHDTLRRLRTDNQTLETLTHYEDPKALADCGNEADPANTPLLTASGLSVLPGGDVVFATGVREIMPSTGNVGTRAVLSRLHTTEEGKSSLSRVSHCTSTQRHGLSFRYDTKIVAAGPNEVLVGDGGRILKTDLLSGQVSTHAQGFRMAATAVSDAVSALIDNTKAFESPVGHMAIAPNGDLYVSTTLARGNTSLAGNYADLIAQFIKGQLDFSVFTGPGTGYRIIKIPKEGSATELVKNLDATAQIVTWPTLHNDIKPWMIPTPGLAFLPTGELIFSVPWENVIKMRKANGDISVIAGTGAQGETGDGGRATNALLNRPSNIVTTNAGDIFFIDAGNRRVRHLRTTNAGDYQISTLFGDQPQKDCGIGVIHGEADAKAIDAGLRRNAGVLCAGLPWDIAIDDTCPSQDGKTRLLISQTFTHPNFNIVEIIRPCMD